MYQDGVCGQGVNYSNRTERGAWHPAGTSRVSFFNENRQTWDGFCPAHAGTAEAHHAADMRRFQLKQPPLPPLPPPPAARQGVGGNRGKGKRKVAGGGGGAAGGLAGALNNRGGCKNATPESIAHEKALLGMSFLRERALTDNDPDLSKPLEMRHQRHEVMDGGDLDDMVSDVTRRCVKGMPVPQKDGSLSRGGPAWNTIQGDSLPLIHLGCPINRANRLVREAGGGGCLLPSSTIS